MLQEEIPEAIRTINVIKVQLEDKNGFFAEVGGRQNQLQFQGYYEKNLKFGIWSTTYKDNQSLDGDNYVKGEKIGQLENVNDEDGKIIGYWNINSDDDEHIDNKGGGYYDKDGLKQGRWIDFHEDYQDLFRVIYQGEYKDGMRIGKWEILERVKNNQQIIGGGQYDEFGIKQGKWIDLHENYSSQCKVTYSGNYMNGMWRGQLSILLWDREINRFEQIGGGSFTSWGAKTGAWVDLDEKFSYSHKVKYSGYYINGKRVDKWSIRASEPGMKDRIFILLGYGLYDEKGVKQGEWTEVDENFSKRKNLIYQGNYRNNIKIGKWFIKVRKESHIDYVADCYEIGSGSYDLEGVKQGKWGELQENCTNECLVIQSGQYMDGIKIGLWNISFSENISEPFSVQQTLSIKQIGGGKYDKNGVKQAKWIEVHESFTNECLVIQQGEYIDDVKTGIWSIQVSEMINASFQQIGGGEYDKNGIKQGQWIELHEDFQKDQQSIQIGSYKNGIRTNNWNNIKRGIVIGKGTLNLKNEKDGFWIENLNDGSNPCQYSKMSGQYKKNKRVGWWNVTYNQKIIGGGYYNKGQKQGFWKEPIKTFNDKYKLIYCGQYDENENRIGKWTINFDGYEIGGGNYNIFGKKQWMWIDVEDDYNYNKQLTYTGEYNHDGQKIGYWETKFKKKQIGYEIYNLRGQKDGFQFEIDDAFTTFQRRIYAGEYRYGRRVGQWTLTVNGILQFQR